MNLTEHAGPKAQIFVRDIPNPYWFASVRDAFAFTLLQETPKAFTAIYVNDMARVKNWEQPEAGAWVEAHKASYVIGSNKRSGMNTDEAIPFSDPDAARAFAVANGGRVVGFDDMPRSYVLASSIGDRP
jgi:copper chaperone NosL